MGARSVRQRSMMPLRFVPIVLTVALSLAACREQPAPNAESASSRDTPRPALPAPRPALTRVAAPSTVCMVNDQYMGREQIPVSVGEKTYCGCCAGCKDKLQNNVSARTAADPVTGKAVDKGSAVIARNDDGKVFYFESEETLGRYGR